MGAQVITNRQFCSPSAANSPTQAAVGTAWANPANWTQIAASTDAVWVVTGVNVWSNADNFPTGFQTDYEVDLGIGGAGSETLIGTVCGRYDAPGGALNAAPIRLPIGIDGLTGRHAFRMRTSNTRTDTYGVSLTFLKNPISGLYLTTRSVLKVSSPAAAPVTVTAGGSAWLDGSWTTLIASAAADLVLVAAMLGNSNAQGELELARRVGGVATSITVIPVGTSNRGTPLVYTLSNPLDKILAGDEVVARYRASAGSATCATKLMYHEKPL